MRRIALLAILFSSWATLLGSDALAAPPAAGAADSRAVFIAEKPVLYGALQAMVQAARRNVLIRLFAFADNDGLLFCSREDQHPMAAGFADVLIRAKRDNPRLDLVLVIDPINFVDYHQNFELPWQRWAERLRGMGGFFNPLAKRLEQMVVVNRAYPERYARLAGKKTVRERLRDAGITVLSTNLFPNPEKNAFFRTKPGREEPADDDDLRLKAIRRLPDEYPSIGDRIALERKLALYQGISLVGDHRKFAVIDDGTLAWNASMNVWDNDYYSPDDGVVCSGALARDLLAQFEDARRSSLSLYGPLHRAGKLPELDRQFSSPGYAFSPDPRPPVLTVAGRTLELSPAAGTVLRDGAIAGRLIEAFDHLEAGGQADVYQTLITDPALIQSIAKAARRGVRVRVLTDAYENVYGQDCSFIHGRAFRQFREAILEGAALQVKAVVPDPRVSEIHRKFALVRGERDDGRSEDFLLTGSANFTVHSSDGTQLEQDILFTHGAVIEQARTWFDAAWTNRIEGEQNMVPRLIRQAWRPKDFIGTGATWFLSLFGLGG
ncbi:MAG: hypothetical protein HY814_02850 [Candidatus Riflebacteria bacterium]|nr:hypothetical protein [Candidatus Riflebacteria bacterium]